MNTNKVLALAREAHLEDANQHDLCKFAALIQREMESENVCICGFNYDQHTYDKNCDSHGVCPDRQGVFRNERQHELIINTTPQSGVREVNTDTVSVPREPSWELQLAIRDKVGISPNQILECLAMMLTPPLTEQGAQMTKADELWEKYSVAEMECGRNVKRVEFLAALAEYGEAVRSEARKVCHTIESVKWNMHLSGKPTTLKCSDAIKEMKLP